MSKDDSRRYDRYRNDNDPSNVYTNWVEAPDVVERVFKIHKKRGHHRKNRCGHEECEAKVYENENYYECESSCESSEYCSCRGYGDCGGCYRPCGCDPHHHHHCPKKTKGFDFCKKKEETKCFKHCAPISQPCDGCYYNYFTSRANLDFSGLVVIKNTSNQSNGCSMKVCVSDTCGTANVATVNPGSSVSLFVEGLNSLDISCFVSDCEPECKGPCTGEVIFDLEYCTIKYVSDQECGDC